MFLRSCLAPPADNLKQLFVFMLLLVPLVSCSVVQDVESLVVSEEKEAPPGQRPAHFVWFELVSSDAQASRLFYTSLFGWTYEFQNEQGNDSVVLHDGRRIGAIVQSANPGQMPPASRWVSFFSVANLDQASRRATTLGATILDGPHSGSERGPFVVVKDPVGAELALIQSSLSAPDAEKPEPGGFIWVDLFTANGVASGAFYRDLAGYEIIQLDEIDHYYFTSGDKIRAGMSIYGWDDVKSNWLPFIGVENLAGTLQEAIALGATVEAYTETAAVVSDPAGAAIGLQLLSKGGRE